MTLEPLWKTYYDELKTEFNNYPDVSNPLHSEGRWFLIRAEKVQSRVLQSVIKNRNSVIIHICSKSWETKSFPDDRGVEKTLVRPRVVYQGIDVSAINRPCIYCDSPVPEDLIGLWTLHNWDHLGK